MMKSLSKKKVILLVLLAFLILFTAFILVNNYCLSTTYGIYTSDKIQNNIRIVFISDLHGRVFGANNKSLIKKILNEEPDIVIMGGDMFGKRVEEGKLIELTKGLSSEVDGVYYTFGNHESRDIDNRSYMEELMKDAGATVLNNSSTTYKKGTTQITIHGIELPLYYYSGYDEDGELIYELKEGDLQTVTEDEESLNILIAHNPIYFEYYAKYGADIVLSGHNHGGVVRLPYVGGIASPNGDFGNIHYDCGEYTKEECSMYLTRGLGEWVGAVRVFNLPEIYVVDVQKST